MANLAASFIGTMASSLMQPVTSSVINSVSAKGDMWQRKTTKKWVYSIISIAFNDKIYV